MKTDFVFKHFQELPNGISEILLCLQTLECLLWFPMFIYTLLMKTDFVFKHFQGWYGVVRSGTEWYVVVRELLE